MKATTNSKSNTKKLNSMKSIAAELGAGFQRESFTDRFGDWFNGYICEFDNKGFKEYLKVEKTLEEAGWTDSGVQENLGNYENVYYSIKTSKNGKFSVLFIEVEDERDSIRHTVIVGKTEDVKYYF